MLRALRASGLSKPGLILNANPVHQKLGDCSFSRRYSSKEAAKEQDSNHKYADTLNLPETTFTNRSNPETNRQIVHDVSVELYKWQKETRQDRELFVLHDGPPYANANLHMGHALNKILKDFINRFQLLDGKQVHYVPGWDCHGLPIELKALESLSKEAGESIVSSPLQVRSLARQHAQHAVDSQMAAFKSWAIMGDWENAYRTLTIDYEIRQLKVFLNMMSQGLISRKRKPVYWGCDTHTALAEGELEYNQKHKSVAAHVLFPAVQVSQKLHEVIEEQAGPKAEEIEQNLKFLIWTTTPWTLIANRAVAINKHIKYSILHSANHGYFVCAETRVDSLKALPSFMQNPADLTEVVTGILGEDLVGSLYHNPLLDDDSQFPVLSGSHVSDSSGTGLVHTAPGHGHDDYLLALKHDLEIYSPVDRFGCYSREVPASLSGLEGLKVLGEGQKNVIALLKEKGMALNLQYNYIHSYPYDWRSKTPIIVRSTPQWFADIGSIKEAASESLNAVKFYPEAGRTRLLSFIKDRSEWCISRQRYWGVPIPVLFNTHTNEPLLSEDCVAHIISQIEKYGTDAWFETEENVSRWLPTEMQHQGTEYYKCSETMDVWFDSGTSWTMIAEALKGVKNRKPDAPVADVYLEGSDQHRGWFQSSLLTKISTDDRSNHRAKAPFGAVITHGFTLDDKGRKMSKSLGNVILPDSIVLGEKNKFKPLGVDGLRLWVASSDYTGDVSVGNAVLNNVRGTLQKLRVTFRYILGLLKDYDNVEVPMAELPPLERYVMSQLADFNTKIYTHYKRYNYNRIIQELNRHMNSELSATYFAIIKDSAYADHPASHKRRSIQTVLKHIFDVYVRNLAPIVPVITQEAWIHAPEYITTGARNVYELGWKNLPEELSDAELVDQFSLIWQIKSAIQLQMEKARKDDKRVGNSLECDVWIEVDPTSKLGKLLKAHENNLADFFICSQVRLHYGDEEIRKPNWMYNSELQCADSSLQLSVVPAAGHKCPRCWKYTAEEESKLCQRCDSVLNHSF